MIFVFVLQFISNTNYTIAFNQVMLPRLRNIYPVNSNKRPPQSPLGNNLSSNRRAKI